MKIRSIALALILPVVSFAFGEATQPKDAPLFPTRNNFFTIPFEIKVDDSSELPAEVELTYSTDRGMNWYPYGRVQPDKKQFLFKSPADGEYWFIFKTYGQDGLVKETRRRGPMLRVLVDTIPPKLSLSAEQKSTGEVAIQWSVEDANLNRKSPQLQISYTVPDQKNTYLSNWKPVAVDPSKTQSEGNTHRGELILWPERDAVSFEIQGEIVDTAGNREMQSRTVSLTTISKATDSNILTESMQAGLKRQLESKPKSLVEAVPKLSNPPARNSGSLALKSPNHSLVPPRPHVLTAPMNRNSDRGPLASLNDLNEAIRTSKEKRTTDSDEEIPDFSNITSPRYANEAGKTAGKDSVLIGPLLFSEDATKNEQSGDSFSVGSPQAPVSTGTNEAIEFPLEEPKSEPESASPEDADGLKLAPLNPKYSTAPSDVLPPLLDDVAVSENEPEEQAAEETTTHPPVQSDKIAEQLAEKSRAQIRIVKVSHMRDLKLSQILVKWETEFDSWPGAEKAKVHLFRGPSQQGPWTPIATEQENLGSYAWTVSQEDRNPFYILVQCENESKDVVSDLTMQPIQLPASLFGK